MPFGYTSRLKAAASRDEGIAPTRAKTDFGLLFLTES
jgi:hypothetical protein